ncbi:MAG: type VI secretion system baseplate subunit TssK [Pirellulaceae bacterium]
MTVHSVHWHEGMFLRPQHFQTAERRIYRQIFQGERWDTHFNWGLRSIALDADALANYRFVLRSVEARLRNGTMVAVPEDGTLSPLDLKDSFGRENALTVYLAIPLLQLNRANVTNGKIVNGARFSVDTMSIEDENTGLNPVAIQLRIPNVKLLTSSDDHAGYEVLPIARVKRADRAEATPQLDESYFPPLLACDGWKPLENSILQPIYDRLGKKLELLSGQIVSRNMTFDSSGQGDRLLFEQLRTMNEAYAPLGMLFFSQGVHPQTAYLELCRLVGRMAIFGAQRRPPELPRYDHDDLASCFWRVKQYIDALLDIVVEPEYKERPFIGAGLRMQVALESAWLESGQQMFVGVQGSLPPEELEKLLTSGLDMKIGSSDRVDEIFRLGRAGLRFTYANHPPRSLPAQPGLVYFKVDRQSQAEEWDSVQRSLTLAIRLNENLIISNIQGQRALSIKVGGQTTTLQFMLFVTGNPTT